MASAALFTDVLAKPRHWANYAPDQTTLLGLVGGASAPDSRACKASVLGMSQHLPGVLAVSLASNLHHVYVAHTPTLIAADPTFSTQFDNNVLVLVRDNLASTLPIVPPQDAFGRCASTHALCTSAMPVDPGFASTTPQVQFGPFTSADADVDSICARCVFDLPHSQVSAAMITKTLGCFANQDFYNTFLNANLTRGDTDRVNAAEPLSDWFRLHSTLDSAGDKLLQVSTIDSGSPVKQQVLLCSVSPVRESLKTLLGVLGPSVTNATFNAGINRIAANMHTNATNHVEYLKQANLKTFTEKHGPHLAQRMHVWCQVVDDVDLSNVLTLMAKSHKSRNCGILQAAIDAHLGAKTLPLPVMRSPMATLKLIDDVFCCFNPVSESHTFGEGLSPFTCVCKGHKEAQEVRQAIREARILEKGGTMSLSDAAAIITTDVCFANTCCTIQVASKKCYRFSILMDLFHGETVDIAQSTHAAMIEVVPLLNH